MEEGAREASLVAGHRTTRGTASKRSRSSRSLGTEPEEPGPETIFLRDASRSIVTRNDSPDIGFEASLNLYRGCEHGCSYCVSGETLVLMAYGSTRPIQDIRAGDEIYGEYILDAA